ncbi:MAG: peptidoglycan glycosyltransferase [Lysinibacillus sp.]|nr:peptidoglycan glycosyltransferase [Lysinibacillus sp.]
MKEWIQQFKEKLIKLNDKIEHIATSSDTSKWRITFSVIWNLRLVFFILFLTGLVFVFSIGVGYFASLVKDEPLHSKEDMRKQVYNYEETSEIYFAGDIYIGKIRTDLDRQETELDKVSPTLIQAVLATEDEYFYEHSGIVPKAVLRGLIQDFTNAQTQTGGSTLTQQLIKNQILTNEVSYERKAREILLAFRLEHFMTKDEILEAYLNIIPYGRNASGRNIAGVETAAQGIFGISASELNLPQAAYIAGIPQAPFAHTPFTQKGQIKSPEGLKPGIERMKTVLYRMKEVGYITEEEYKEAINYDITKDFREPEAQSFDNYPYLTFEIERRAKEIMARILAERDGIDPKRLDEEENLYEKYIILADRDVRSGGYRIYTTIDKDMYDAMNKAAKEFKYYGHTFTKKEIDPETNEEVEVPVPVQVGSILIENNTGKILSFVGGRDFEITELNHATQAYRSNGSTMKPLLVYAPAIEYGLIGAGSPVVDVKFVRKSDGYAPSNYYVNEERGVIPAREALAHSQNLTAVRLYDQIIDRRPAEFLEKMKFSKLTKGDYENLATSIGALEIGTTVEENTNAFATFANGGKFIEAYMIEKIVDVDGNVIFEHKPEPVEVFSPETSYIITDMLRDVLEYGTAVRARTSLKFSSDFAAKTGTSQDTKDIWIVGYNPNVSLGVWLGYDQPRTLFQFNNRYFHPSTRGNLLWAALMNAAYDVNPELIGTKERFKQPEDVVTASFCGISGMAPSKACSDAGLVRSDLFIRKFVPTVADNSLISAETNTVNINGESYLALDTTPVEFTLASSGLSLNQEFAEKMLGRLGGDPNKLLGDKSLKIVTAKEFQPDDVAPQPVNATIQGNTLSWSQSSSNDVVGYRIYNMSNGERQLFASVRSGENLSIAVNGGVYSVVAVDITGLESPLSNLVTIGVTEQPTPDNGEDNFDDELGDIPMFPDDIEFDPDMNNEQMGNTNSRRNSRNNNENDYNE